jgi:hypothetical protein
MSGTQDTVLPQSHGFQSITLVVLLLEHKSFLRDYSNLDIGSVSTNWTDLFLNTDRGKSSVFVFDQSLSKQFGQDRQAEAQEQKRREI